MILLCEAAEKLIGKMSSLAEASAICLSQKERENVLFGFLMVFFQEVSDSLVGRAVGASLF